MLSKSTGTRAVPLRLPRAMRPRTLASSLLRTKGQGLSKRGRRLAERHIALGGQPDAALKRLAVTPVQLHSRKRCVTTFGPRPPPALPVARALYEEAVRHRLPPALRPRKRCVIDFGPPGGDRGLCNAVKRGR